MSWILVASVSKISKSDQQFIDFFTINLEVCLEAKQVANLIWWPYGGSGPTRNFPPQIKKQNKLMSCNYFGIQGTTNDISFFKVKMILT